MTGNRDAASLSAAEFVDAADEYWRENGWTTERHEVADGAYVLAGVQSERGGRRTGLLMVVPGLDAAVTGKHVKYLLSAGSKRDVDWLGVVTRGKTTDRAGSLVDEHGVEVVDASTVVAGSAPTFEASTEDVTFPDDDATGHSSGDPETAREATDAGQSPTDSELSSAASPTQQSGGDSPQSAGDSGDAAGAAGQSSASQSSASQSSASQSSASQSSAGRPFAGDSSAESTAAQPTAGQSSAGQNAGGQSSGRSGGGAPAAREPAASTSDLPLASGAVMGAVAFLANYLVVLALFVAEFAGDTFAVEGVKIHEYVGWVFYGAHTVKLGTASGETVDILNVLYSGGGSTAVPKLAYFAAPVVGLVAAGYAVGRRTNPHGPDAGVEAAKSGALVAVGYAALTVVAAKTVFSVTPPGAATALAPKLGVGAMLMAVGYPVVLGGIGGYLGGSSD